MCLIAWFDFDGLHKIDARTKVEYHLLPLLLFIHSKHIILLRKLIQLFYAKEKVLPIKDE